MEKRSNEEIDAMIKKGDKFTEKYPHTMFGHDNVADLKLFKKIMEKVKAGKTFNEIEDWINETWTEEDEISTNNFACDALNWAFKEGLNDEFW